MKTLSLTVLSLADRCWFCGRQMGEYGNMMYYGHGMVFLWILVFAIACAIVFLFVRGSKKRHFESHLKETALDILEKRYALGEIDKDQFLSMKKDIER